MYHVIHVFINWTTIPWVTSSWKVQPCYNLTKFLKKLLCLNDNFDKFSHIRIRWKVIQFCWLQFLCINIIQNHTAHNNKCALREIMSWTHIPIQIMSYWLPTNRLLLLFDIHNLLEIPLVIGFNFANGTWLLHTVTYLVQKVRTCDEICILTNRTLTVIKVHAFVQDKSF